MDIDDCFGKAIMGADGEIYGPIRYADKPFPEELDSLTIVAEDECGNYFLSIGGQIYFWDHETCNRSLLAESLSEFKSSCIEPENIKLNPADVISAWIDPDFAKLQGIKQ
jgi:hypothetical protein